MLITPSQLLQNLCPCRLTHRFIHSGHGNSHFWHNVSFSASLPPFPSNKTFGAIRPLNLLSLALDWGIYPMQNGVEYRHSVWRKPVISDAVNERSTPEEELLQANAALAERLRERTQQLEAVNKELELLAYSISHDVKAPLRSIRGLSEVLVERYSDQLDQTGRDFLRRIFDSSQQMSCLMGELVKLSRIGRCELACQPV